MEPQVIVTEAPISMDNIYKHVLNPDVSFVIMMEQSKLSPEILMDYLSNVKVPCEISFMNASDELKIQTVKAYMETFSVVDVPSLSLTVAALMLWLKGDTYFFERIANPVLTPQLMDRFIEENGDLLNRWEIMLDSMIVFTIAASKLAIEALGNPKDQHPVIDDLRYCGNNFIWVFGIDGFVEVYYQSVNSRNFRYFTRQFEEYMFDSANLFKYFLVANNPLPALLSYISTTPFGEESHV